MKRYIAAILVPCLLMQLFGCISSREISLEELPNSEDAIITAKDSNIYHLKKSLSNADLYLHTEVFYSDNWLIKTDVKMIYLNTLRAYKDDTLSPYEADRRNPGLVIKKDTAILNYEDISNVSVEFVDEGKTFELVVLSLIVVAGIVIAIIAATAFPLDFNFGNSTN